MRSRHALRARGGFRLIGAIDVSVFLVLTIVTGLRDRLLGSDSGLKLWTIWHVPIYQPMIIGTGFGFTFVDNVTCFNYQPMIIDT